MNFGQNNLRRAHLSATKSAVSMDESTTQSSLSPSHEALKAIGPGKKAPKSMLSLSCQRVMVRFLALRKTSQVLMAVIIILVLLLLPMTIYFMSRPLSDYNAFTREGKVKKIHYEGLHSNAEQMGGPTEITEDVKGMIIQVSRKHFSNRRTFPPLEPRVVRLTDKNHTYQFADPPGIVNDLKYDDSNEGLRELHKRYIELRTKNPSRKSVPDTLGEGDCEPIDSSWQLAYHPTCNQIHEASGGWQKLYRTAEETNDSSGTEPNDKHREQLRLLNKGAFRHVFMIRDHDGITKRVMKTLRSLRSSEKNFDLRNHDRHRRDALAFEELSSSPVIVDLYASCSNTGLFDYADKGDLYGIFDDKEEIQSPEELEQFKLYIMQIAYNVSKSVHDAHHFDKQGRATMAHTDIKVNQFLYQDGFYKLSDFNRVRFLTWDSKLNKQCGFYVGKNGGEYRSPEEYLYQEETEKVDVYSLGNVLYFLLVEKDVWDEFDHKQVYELVKKGKRPKFPDEIKKSDGVYEKYMVRAIENAWIHLPQERPGALEVANIIKEGIDIITGKRN